MATAVAAALLAVGLTGCTQPPAPTTSTPPTGTVEVPIQPTITPIDTALPTANDTEAAQSGGFDRSADLVEHTCDAEGDTWAFHATLRNPDPSAHTYTVAVFVSHGLEGKTVTKEVDVLVPPGESKDVDIPAIVTMKVGEKDSDYSCLTGVTIKDQ